MRCLLSLSILLSIFVSAAGQSVSRYGFSFESSNAAMSGVVMLRDSAGIVDGAIVNDFGVSAVAFSCDTSRDRVDLKSLVGFLDKWWIRPTLKKDLLTAVKTIRSVAFRPGSEYSISLCDDTLSIINLKRSTAYRFHPVDSTSAPVSLRGVTDRVPFDIWAATGVDAEVRLTPYLADGDNNPACIVCPGGSYFWLDRKTEGRDVAEWLQTNGISAFVLEYRVGGIPAFAWHTRLFYRGNRYPDMLCDLQRSIMVLRSDPARFGIDPERIGVMGFSAGGHLAAMSGIYFDAGVLPASVADTEISLRPDFVASIYPVVTFTDHSVHKRSRRGALGEWHDISEAMKDSLSLERHVRHDMPPVYLMNCVDDPVVKYRNSQLLDSAMTVAGVPHCYRLYQTGGHGFGATESKTSPEAAQWKSDFLHWLHDLFLDR